VDSLVTWIQGRLSGTTTPLFGVVPQVEDAAIVPSDKNTILIRTFLFVLGSVVLCVSFSFWSMFHHFRDVSFELSDARIVGQREIVSVREDFLRPGETKDMAFSIDRPPPGQVLHLVGHYRTDSVKTSLHVDLLHGISLRRLEQVLTCAAAQVPKKTRYDSSSLLFNRREQSFSREVDFGAGDPTVGCVRIHNAGEKTESFVEVKISLVYLKDQPRPDGLMEHIK
jgi:hypothetical protein